MQQRIILHCDCNGYYASVESLLHPELRGVPMAVAGNPDNRHGIILAKNQLAKDAGVVTAETILEARKKCPNLVCVKPHHELYQEYSVKINNIYREYTDRVEPFGIDESFLDVTSVWHNFANTPASFADMLRKRIRNNLGLTISVGVSYNKILAKLGSDLKKPDATTIIRPEDLASKVWPLDINNLLYVGKVTSERLRKLNINTIGDIAKTDPDFLASYLGKTGENLSLYARGMENSEVQKFEELDEAKSIGNGVTFKKDLTTWSQIEQGLDSLINEVAARLNKAGKIASVVQVQMKTFDFKVFSRQTTLSTHINDKEQIQPIAYQLMEELWDKTTPIRLLAVTLSGLENHGEVFTQMSFSDLKHVNNEMTTKLNNTELHKLIFNLNQKMGGPYLHLGIDELTDKEKR